MKMVSMDQLHEQAMDLSDQADVAKKQGQHEEASKLYNQAAQLEARAARYFENDFTAEPTRAILYRSAAALAIDAGDKATAKRLIHQALAGFPPQEIENELTELLDRIDFERHLAADNIALQPEEMQFTINGNSVGDGISLADIFLSRVKVVEKLIQRTAERLSGIIFRAQGPPRADLANKYSVYMSPPREGSFAVTLRLGLQQYLPLDGMTDQPKRVIDEVLQGITLVEQENYEELERLITNQTYRENFIGLTRLMAPDGDKVKYVGLTAERDGKEIQVTIRRNRKEIQLLPTGQSAQALTQDQEEIPPITGQLLLADNRPRKRRGIGEIHLIAENGTEVTIKVSDGMTDIVRSLYDEVVTVEGYRKGGHIYLRDIDPA